MNWLTSKFEVSRGGSSSNSPPMEGLRGLAVALVFCVHFVALATPWISLSPRVFAVAGFIEVMGHAGVDLFFVLSGYLIYGSLISRPQNFIRYMRRRVARIYPTFIAVFALYVLLSFVFPSKSKIPSSIGDGAMYLAANFLLLPGILPIEPLITVAWSLSYEMFFYLAVPCAITVLGLRHRTPMWRSAFFLAVGACLVWYFAFHGGPIRLAMFVSGILLFEAMQSSRIPTPNSVVGFAALTLGLLSMHLPTGGLGSYALTICVLFVAFPLVCLTCLRSPSSRFSRWFAWTPLRWLGNMSYSYYLIHGITLSGAFWLVSCVVPVSRANVWVILALLPLMFFLTLLSAATLFLAVERPYSLIVRRVTAIPNNDDELMLSEPLNRLARETP